VGQLFFAFGAEVEHAMATYHMNWIASVELLTQDRSYAIDEDELRHVPEKGHVVYVFCRHRGDQFIPQYVGRSNRPRKRLKEHLSSERMSQAIAESGNGKRVVLIASVKPRPGQKAEQVARAVEGLLIRKFHAEGWDLLNNKGTKRPRKDIRWRGSNQYLKLVPREMFI
jgi:hypothetical protein